MNEPSKIWQWLLDENNRGALALVGGCLVVTGGAVWKLIIYFRKRKAVPQTTDASNRTTNINQPDSSQYVEQMHGGSLTINSGLSPDQIQAIGQLLNYKSVVIDGRQFEVLSLMLL